jgi:hypothetical protein
VNADDQLSTDVNDIRDDHGPIDHWRLLDCQVGRMLDVVGDDDGLRAIVWNAAMALGNSALAAKEDAGEP